MTRDEPRHDRTGDVADTPEHDPRCKDGWIDRDADRPVPCLDCRPHLRPVVRHHPSMPDSRPGGQP
jgi:hypothetical protein